MTKSRVLKIIMSVCTLIVMLLVYLDILNMKFSMSIVFILLGFISIINGCIDCKNKKAEKIFFSVSGIVTCLCSIILLI